MMCARRGRKGPGREEEKRADRSEEGTRTDGIQVIVAARGKTKQIAQTRMTRKLPEDTKSAAKESLRSFEIMRLCRILRNGQGSRDMRNVSPERM